MYTLQRSPGGMIEYMTLHPDYNVGNGFCAWSADPGLAFGFARQLDAEQFQKKYRHWFDHRVSVSELNG